MLRLQKDCPWGQINSASTPLPQRNREQASLAIGCDFQRRQLPEKKDHSAINLNMIEKVALALQEKVQTVKASKNGKEPGRH